MADPHVDTATENPAHRGPGDAKANKTNRNEPASFRSDRDAGWLGGSGPEPATLAGARELLAAGRSLVSSRREAALTGTDLWLRSFEPVYAFHASMMGWFEELWRETTSGLYPAEPSRALSAAPILGLPPVDVRETAEAYALSIELPGLSDEDVKVSVEGDMLRVRGHKSQERDEATASYRLSERRFGRFERAFRLPDGLARDRLDASLRDGVLKIVLPKVGAPEPGAPAGVRH